MKSWFGVCLTILILSGISMFAQVTNSPVYHVTVIERNIDAVNYDYRSYPTSINFRGTVLLSESKGTATVQSKRGRTEIDARFEKLPSPQRFGREYLTYVLWAITPEGRPHNLGEMVVGSSDRAHLQVTTDLQTFGMIVTAEPYSAVRQPGDVVVLENRVRPDTIGIIKPIQAKYDLLPRGHYVWEGPNSQDPAVVNAPKVSMERYEALSQVYQAQNAIGIARQADAERYAPNTFNKAQQLWAEAQAFEHDNATLKRSVQSAREAIQTAEDARLIAERRKQEEQLMAAQNQAVQAEQATLQVKTQAQADVEHARNEADSAQQAKAQAEIEAGRARADAAAARAQAESDRIAREQVERELLQTKARTANQQNKELLEARKTSLRMSLLEQLNGALPTRDTPRGLVVTLADSNFNGAVLRGPAADQVRKIRLLVAAHLGLLIQVQGYSDIMANQWLSRRRAEDVQGLLLAGGILSPGTVTARGFGDSVPIVSNASAAGREENRRVEIVISGAPIGEHAFWDHTYTLTLR